MQWATRYYKAHGGTYAGRKSGSNRLSKWTRQRWRTHSGRKSAGRLRYLPDAAWKRLSPDQIRRTNAASRAGRRAGASGAAAGGRGARRVPRTEIESRVVGRQHG